MLLLASSSEFIFIPLSGPVADLTVYPVSIAIVPEGSGEPATNLYAAGTWINGEAALKVNTGDLAAGAYMAYVRIQAGAEDVRLQSGRIRVGDARL